MIQNLLYVVLSSCFINKCCKLFTSIFKNINIYIFKKIKKIKSSFLLVVFLLTNFYSQPLLAGSQFSFQSEPSNPLPLSEKDKLERNVGNFLTNLVGIIEAEEACTSIGAIALADPEPSSKTALAVIDSACWLTLAVASGVAYYYEVNHHEKRLTEHTDKDVINKIKNNHILRSIEPTLFEVTTDGVSSIFEHLTSDAPIKNSQIRACKNPNNFCVDNELQIRELTDGKIELLNVSSMSTSHKWLGGLTDNQLTGLPQYRLILDPGANEKILTYDVTTVDDDGNFIFGLTTLTYPSQDQVFTWEYDKQGHVMTVNTVINSTRVNTWAFYYQPIDRKNTALDFIVLYENQNYFGGFEMQQSNIYQFEYVKKSDDSYELQEIEKYTNKKLMGYWKGGTTATNAKPISDLAQACQTDHLCYAVSRQENSNQSSNISSKLFKIQSKNIDGCLNINIEDDNADIESCHSGDNQVFHMISDGEGYYEIKSKHSDGYCLDMQLGSNNAFPQKCLGKDNQKYKLILDEDGFYRIKPKNNDKKCLAVKKKNKNAYFPPCRNKDKEKFKLNSSKIYTIPNRVYKPNSGVWVPVLGFTVQSDGIKLKTFSPTSICPTDFIEFDAPGAFPLGDGAVSKLRLTQPLQQPPTAVMQTAQTYYFKATQITLMAIANSVLKQPELSREISHLFDKTKLTIKEDGQWMQIKQSETNSNIELEDFITSDRSQKFREPHVETSNLGVEINENTSVEELQMLLCYILPATKLNPGVPTPPESTECVSNTGGDTEENPTPLQLYQLARYIDKNTKQFNQQLIALKEKLHTWHIENIKIDHETGHRSRNLENIENDSNHPKQFYFDSNGDIRYAFGIILKGHDNSRSISFCGITQPCQASERHIKAYALNRIYSSDDPNLEPFWAFVVDFKRPLTGNVNLLNAEFAKCDYSVSTAAQYKYSLIFKMPNDDGSLESIDILTDTKFSLETKGQFKISKPDHSYSLLPHRFNIIPIGVTTKSTKSHQSVVNHLREWLVPAPLMALQNTYWDNGFLDFLFVTYMITKDVIAYKYSTLKLELYSELNARVSFMEYKDLVENPAHTAVIEFAGLSLKARINYTGNLNHKETSMSD